VTAFGATTAVSYALYGLVDWPIAGLFILGGATGGFVGIKIASRLAAHKRALSVVFSCVVAAAGIYVVAKGLIAVLR
jgi:uncharacterized protein